MMVAIEYDGNDGNDVDDDCHGNDMTHGNDGGDDD